MMGMYWHEAAAAIEADENKVGTMAVMGKEGDTKYSWDRSNPADVAIARKTFNKFRAIGHTAYRVSDKNGESRGEVMTSFDPEAEKIIFSVQMAGG